MGAINTFINLVRDNAHFSMIVVEIGIWQGDTAMKWLPIIKAHGGRGILVDHFRGNLTDISGTCPWAPDLADIRCAALAERVTAAGLDDVTEIWQAPSVRASQNVFDGSCDIVLIDADHRKSQVSRDIRFWLPKVRPGGILCGHDVHALEDAADLPEETWEVDAPVSGPHHRRHCGVDRAVWEAFGADGVEVLGDNVWVRRVPG